MKCGLVQILAVAMVLGHTVLAPWLKFPSKILTSKIKDKDGVSGVTTLLESTVESEEMKLVKKLLAEVDTKIRELFTANFIQFTGTTEEPAYVTVNKLLSIKKYLMQYTDEDTNTLLTEVNKKIDVLVENLQKAKQKIENNIRQNNYDHHDINNEIFRISSSSFSDVKIQWVRDVCNKAGIGFPNTDEELQLKDKKKLKQVEKVLDDQLVKNRIIVRKIDILLWQIKNNKIMQTWDDTRDTQSMRNVIGISIAVCTIVTLCIVLLIAVRNKHRTNAGVKLLNWV